MTAEANSYPLTVTALVETLITAMVQVSPFIIRIHTKSPVINVGY